MRSPTGFVAAAVFLAALPLTFAYQQVAGAGAEIVVHALLALGALLMAVATFDFNTPRWVRWAGSLSIGALAAIFFMQGMGQLTHNATLTHVAYQIFGQRAEASLVYLFLSWCVTLLMVDSRGRTQVLGFVALFAAVVGIAVAELKVLSRLPFVWLLFESRKRTVSLDSRRTSSAS
jgi:hypothetical protein